MLLAKLKFAFLGVVTLAVVSTSVGVVAQDGPAIGASDNDRLKAVEQKLDRLLEVLGGSSARPRPADAPFNPQSQDATLPLPRRRPRTLNAPLTRHHHQTRSGTRRRAWWIHASLMQPPPRHQTFPRRLLPRRRPVPPLKFLSNPARQELLMRYLHPGRAVRTWLHESMSWKGGSAG